MNLGERILPIETVTTGRRERLLNILGNGQVIKLKSICLHRKKKKKSRGEILLRGQQLHC